MTSPLKERFTPLLENNPAAESFVAALDEQWPRLMRRLHTLYNAGNTVHETILYLTREHGVESQQAADELEKLRAQNKRQHDSIVRQAATIKRMQAQLDDIDEMPIETREQLIRQAMERMGHRRRGRR